MAKKLDLEDRVEFLEIVHDSTCVFIDEQMLNITNELEGIQGKLAGFRSDMDTLERLKQNLLEVCYRIRNRTNKVEKKINRVFNE